MLRIRFIADNDLTRRMGLMHQASLEEDECVLFDFPRTGNHSFWNKNVDFPISLIFCDKQGVVKDIKSLEAQQTKGVYPSAYDVKYVVEAHIDAPEKHGIKKGKKLMFEKENINLEK